MALVSIIMPAYNCERYLEKAIDSILNQTWQNFELLIADDCSKDNTKQIIEAYEKKDTRIKAFYNDENLGYLKATNFLFEKCTGDFITFQDADDWCTPERIETLLNAFNDNPKLGCVGSFVKRVDSLNQEIGVIKFETTYDKIRADIPARFNCVGSALMITREVYSKIGGYHLYFNRIASEDLYWFGLIVLNYPTINVPAELYFYRDTAGSVSNEKNKPIKKQASKDMAVEALEYYIKKGKPLFNSKLALKGAELFVFGKYYCWNARYGKGVGMIALSLFIYPNRFRDAIGLLRQFIPRVLFSK